MNPFNRLLLCVLPVLCLGFLSFHVEGVAQTDLTSKPVRRLYLKEKIKDRFKKFATRAVFSTEQIQSIASVDSSKMRLKLNRRSLEKILEVMPEEMRLKIKTPDGVKRLSLIRQDVMAPNIIIRTSTGDFKEPIDRGVYYQGIVENSPAASMVSLGFDRDSLGNPRVEGMIELGSKKFQIGGEINPSKVAETQVFDVNALPDQNDKSCAMEDMPEELQSSSDSLLSGAEGGAANRSPATMLPEIAATFPLSPNPVKIFIEADYQLYLDKGASVPNVVAYLTTIFNRVQAIYANEGIQVQLSEIFVWNTLDPYSTFTTTTFILPQFATNRTSNHSGDIAVFATTRNVGGGVAYINTLCNKFIAHAVTGIYKTLGTSEIYDWSIEVLTHELGHSLGSRHTQWCGWPGGAIDGCWTPEGTCARGPLPALNMGTIMSYCHQAYGVGISFVNGFGPLPGDTIRNSVTNAACIKPNYIDKTPPSSSISSPLNGAIVSGDVTIKANAGDNYSTISKVEFYVGAQLVASDLTAPFSFLWATKNFTNGDKFVRLQAFDSAGNKAFSSDTLLTVQNGVADTVAPAATISTPTAGATVSGTVQFSATATDNLAVTQVRFFNGAKLLNTVTAAPFSFSWNTLNEVNGTATLKVEAQDAAGNIGSTTRTVTINNIAAAPVVSITAPISNATLSGNATISANATSSVSITKVDFYQGTTLIGTDTTSPYSISWSTSGLLNGVYGISARATDANSTVGTSSTISVAVSNPVLSTPLTLVGLTAGQNLTVVDTTKRNWARVQLNPEIVGKVLTFSAKTSINTAWSGKSGTSLRKISDQIYDVFLNSPNTSYDVKVDCSSCTPTAVQGTIRTLP